MGGLSQSLALAVPLQVKKTLALLGLSPAALVMLGLFLALSPLTLAYGVCKAPNSIW
eukprot:COSAG01_NODE_829_length_13273_cov_7.729695_9_plen_57_part_00